MSMIANYFRVATRNVLKHKLYSFIHIFGLSVSMACCLLIYLFINDEYSFDRFHANTDRIYRIEDRKYNVDDPASPDRYIHSAWIQAPIGPLLKEELPEVEYSTRFSSWTGVVMRYNDKVFSEKLTYVDRDFFSMFSFPLIKGSSEKIFTSKQEIVLTPDIARKYFGDEDPIGKTIHIDGKRETSFTVTGIIAAPPRNSSLSFEMLAPQENRSNYEYIMNTWDDTNTPVFVQLAASAEVSQFGHSLDQFFRKYEAGRIQRWENMRREKKISDDLDMISLVYTPLADVHMKYQTFWTSVSNPKYSVILGGIAALILVIACVNYISLALTGSTTRRKEVGVRKVTGAQRWQLIRQFGAESFVLTTISTLIAFVFVILLRPSFNELTGRDISINFVELALIGTIMAALVALLAGSYPALYLSSLKPALVLKGVGTTRLQSNFTKGLVALQFALSSFLIVSAVVMNRQMEFITTKDLGFDKEQVIVIPTQRGREESNKFVERFRTELQKVPSVVSISGTSSSFGGGTWRNDIKRGDQVIPAYIYAVDDNYISTLGLDLVAGRNFDGALASDTMGIIVNEAMVRAMEWRNPVDEQLKWRGPIADRVIGVVKDYHFMSLEHEIGPIILSINKNKVGYLSTMFVKVEAGAVSSSVAQIQSAWKSIAPDKPFNYSFLDDDVSWQYGEHKLWTKLMTLATAIGIVIACMGLFGLSGMNAVSRTKEIGIRKALGAEVVNIVVMMNKPYLWLAGIAFLIAVPLAGYAMDKWLSVFEFRISIDAMLIIGTMTVSLLITLVSVSYHSVKAGLMDPGRVLKSE